jgi:aspartyl-tRNA(Asn)/glutamyl-tRNA(Gln) amidotransferase subunit B
MTVVLVTSHPEIGAAHGPSHHREPAQARLRSHPSFAERVNKTLVAIKESSVTIEDLDGPSTEVLTADRPMADFFEACVALQPGQAKGLANWVMGELARKLNDGGLDIAKSPVTPALLVDLLKLIEAGTISGKIAKTVFDEMWATGHEPARIVEEQGLVQVSDTGAIEPIIDGIIAANPAQVEEYRSGKEKVFGFFVGQVMKVSKGKANPTLVNELLKRKLSGE